MIKYDIQVYMNTNYRMANTDGVFERPANRNVVELNTSNFNCTAAGIVGKGMTRRVVNITSLEVYLPNEVEYTAIDYIKLTTDGKDGIYDFYFFAYGDSAVLESKNVLRIPVYIDMMTTYNIPHNLEFDGVVARRTWDDVIDGFNFLPEPISKSFPDRVVIASGDILGDGTNLTPVDAKTLVAVFCKLPAASSSQIDSLPDGAGVTYNFNVGSPRSIKISGFYFIDISDDGVMEGVTRLRELSVGETTWVGEPVTIPMRGVNLTTTNIGGFNYISGLNASNVDFTIGLNAVNQERISNVRFLKSIYYTNLYTITALGSGESKSYTLEEILESFNITNPTELLGAQITLSTLVVPLPSGSIYFRPSQLSLVDPEGERDFRTFMATSVRAGELWSDGFTLTGSSGLALARQSLQFNEMSYSIHQQQQLNNYNITMNNLNRGRMADVINTTSSNILGIETNVMRDMANMEARGETNSFGFNRQGDMIVAPNRYNEREDLAALQRDQSMRLNTIGIEAQRWAVENQSNTQGFSVQPPIGTDATRLNNSSVQGTRLETNPKGVPIFDNFFRFYGYSAFEEYSNGTIDSLSQWDEAEDFYFVAMGEFFIRRLVGAEDINTRQFREHLKSELKVGGRFWSVKVNDVRDRIPFVPPPSGGGLNIITFNSELTFNTFNATLNGNPVIQAINSVEGTAVVTFNPLIDINVSVRGQVRSIAGGESYTYSFNRSETLFISAAGEIETTVAVDGTIPLRMFSDSGLTNEIASGSVVESGSRVYITSTITESGLTLYVRHSINGVFIQEAEFENDVVSFEVLPGANVFRGNESNLTTSVQVIKVGVEATVILGDFRVIDFSQPFNPNNQTLTLDSVQEGNLNRLILSINGVNQELDTSIIPRDIPYQDNALNVLYLLNSDFLPETLLRVGIDDFIGSAVNTLNIRLISAFIKQVPFSIGAYNNLLSTNTTVEARETAFRIQHAHNRSINTRIGLLTFAASGSDDAYAAIQVRKNTLEQLTTIPLPAGMVNSKSGDGSGGTSGVNQNITSVIEYQRRFVGIVVDDNYYCACSTGSSSIRSDSNFLSYEGVEIPQDKILRDSGSSTSGRVILFFKLNLSDLSWDFIYAYMTSSTSNTAVNVYDRITRQFDHNLYNVYDGMSIDIETDTLIRRTRDTSSWYYRLRGITTTDTNVSAYGPTSISKFSVGGVEYEDNLMLTTTGPSRYIIYRSDTGKTFNNFSYTKGGNYVLIDDVIYPTFGNLIVGLSSEVIAPFEVNRTGDTFSGILNNLSTVVIENTFSPILDVSHSSSRIIDLYEDVNGDVIFVTVEQTNGCMYRNGVRTITHANTFTSGTTPLNLAATCNHPHLVVVPTNSNGGAYIYNTYTHRWETNVYPSSIPIQQIVNEVQLMPDELGTGPLLDTNWHFQHGPYAFMRNGVRISYRDFRTITLSPGSHTFKMVSL